MTEINQIPFQEKTHYKCKKTWQDTFLFWFAWTLLNILKKYDFGQNCWWQILTYYIKFALKFIRIHSHSKYGFKISWQILDVWKLSWNFSTLSRRTFFFIKIWHIRNILICVLIYLAFLSISWPIYMISILLYFTLSIFWYFKLYLFKQIEHVNMYIL